MKGDWDRGRYPSKVTMHWLRAAFDRVSAGEPEQDVLDDYGYVMPPADLAARAQWHQQQAAECFRQIGSGP